MFKIMFFSRYCWVIILTLRLYISFSFIYLFAIFSSTLNRWDTSADCIIEKNFRNFPFINFTIHLIYYRILYTFDVCARLLSQFRYNTWTQYVSIYIYRCTCGLIKIKQEFFNRVHWYVLYYTSHGVYARSIASKKRDNFFLFRKWTNKT